jgi:hypothetical protein
MFAVITPLASPVYAAYDPLGEVCADNKGSSSPTCKENNNQKDANTNPFIGSDGLIMKISMIVASVAAIVAVIMVIIGGAGMITSGGDASKLKEARGRVIHSLIGLAIIAIAQVIVAFVVINLF